MTRNPSTASSPTTTTAGRGSTRKLRGRGFVAVALVLTSCHGTAATSDVDVATPLPTPVPSIASDVWDARGLVVEKSDVTTTFDDPDEVIGQAWRGVYRSASGTDGRARTVSGVFLVPRGSPPAGGWPVVSMAHGTTGIGSDCGPSRDATLMGFLPGALAYLADGYAIAMTDYEGLGGPGEHPYLEPRTSAFNVIDAVRALRNLFPEVSPRWVAFGNSQGGQAVWAADELARWYGSQLELMGAVALSPAANLTALADRAFNKTLTTDQRALLPLVVEGLQRFTPGLADLALLPDVPPTRAAEMFSCGTDAKKLRSEFLPAEGVGLKDEATATVLRNALRKIALPQSPLTVPMLVINGLADSTIPPQWVTAAVDEACQRGGRVEHLEVTEAGHGDLGDPAYSAAAEWVRDRFDSMPAPSNCGAAPITVP